MKKQMHTKVFQLLFALSFLGALIAPQESLGNNCSSYFTSPTRAQIIFQERPALPTDIPLPSRVSVLNPTEFTVITLEQVEAQHQKGRRLSIQELQFLYEIARPLPQESPALRKRLQTLRTQRNPIEDLLDLFGIRDVEIHERLLNLETDLRIHYGDLNLELEDFKKSQSPQYLLVVGNVNLGKTAFLENTQLPIFIMGDLIAPYLTTAYRSIFPSFIGGDAVLDGLIATQSSILPAYVLGELRLDSFSNSRSSTFPKMVSSYIHAPELDLYIGTALFQETSYNHAQFKNRVVLRRNFSPGTLRPSDTVSNTSLLRRTLRYLFKKNNSKQEP